MFINSYLYYSSNAIGVHSVILNIQLYIANQTTSLLTTLPLLAWLNPDHAIAFVNIFSNIDTSYDTSSAKDTWAAIKLIMNSNSNQTKFPKYFQINDMHVVDKKVIANQFNEFFVNIGSKLAQTIPNVDTQKTVNSYLTIRPLQHLNLN